MACLSTSVYKPIKINPVNPKKDYRFLVRYVQCFARSVLRPTSGYRKGNVANIPSSSSVETQKKTRKLSLGNYVIESNVDMSVRSGCDYKLNP